MPMRTIFIIMAAALILTAVDFQARAKPVDVSIGGTALYNWWNPYWNNHKIMIQTQDLRRVVDTRAPRYSIIQQFLYGADVSIKFLGNWEISPSFQYGEALTKGGNVAFYPMNMFPFLNPMYRTISMKLKQYNIYSSFGYYIVKYLKCYLGLRIEIINNSIVYNHLDLNPMFPPNELFVLEMYMKTLHITPEAGFNIILPISDAVSFICAVSGTLQSGSNRSDYGKTYSFDGWLIIPKINFRSILRDIYLAAGCNTAAAFKITIPVVDISVTMGGYYRILRYFQTNHNRGVFDLDGSYDHKYGFFYSVAYTFSFGQRKKPNIWIPRPNY